MNTVETETGILVSKPIVSCDSGGKVCRSQQLLSVERAQKLDLLLHLISNLNESLIVCGSDGIGKSTVLRFVEERKLPTWSVCSISATSGLTFQRIQDRLLQTIVDDQQYANFDEVDILLKNKLAQFALKSRYLILLLDDAGSLMPGVLTRICAFAESFGVLRLVFSMTADHLQLMVASDPVIDNCQVIEVPPLTEQQTEEFLKNLSGKPSSTISFQTIDSPLVQKIYQESHGVPGEILALLPEISKEGDIQIAATPFPVVSALILVLAFGVGLFLWNNTRGVDGDFNVVTKLASTNTDKGKPSTAVPMLSLKSRETSVDSVQVRKQEKPEADGPSVAVDQSGMPLKSSSGLIQFNDTHELLDLSEQSVVEFSNIEPSPDGLITDDVTQVDAIEQHVRTTLPSAISITDDTINESLSDDAQQVALVSGHSNLTKLGIEKNVQAKSTDTREADENKGKAVSGLVNSDSIVGVKGVDWILEQEGGRYTLQLIAVKDFDDMVGFVKKYSALENLALFKTTKKNQDWYALIYGNYSSLSVAKEEAHNLPRELQKSWPRKLKSVQNSISKFDLRR